MCVKIRVKILSCGLKMANNFRWLRLFGASCGY